jgi:HD-GYP domain-containing protein (c-di-GMP phosphodiesterase class II)
MSWLGKSTPVGGRSVDALAMLEAARQFERNAQVPQAISCLEAVIAESDRVGEHALLAEALRRLSIIRHKRDEWTQARALAERSYGVARAAGLKEVAAEALNTLGAQHLQTGNLAAARGAFFEAIDLGRESLALRARVEQNLGILANIQGRLDEAIVHYGNSLEAYRSCGDEQGCAISYHNLGMASADRERLDEAEHHFIQSYAIGGRIGDLLLQASCLVSLAEVDIARQRFENARQRAEEGLAMFDRLGVRRGKADAYRVIGMVYREIGRPALAESRLTAALDLAVSADAALIEAEAAHEMALLVQSMGRNQDALKLLNRAHQLFKRLEARADLINVGGKMATLQGTYLSVVHEWGQSIESTDISTFGHCERVARNTVKMARALKMSEAEETELLVGAFLHDVGMVRVPHEVLRRREALTPEEERLLEMHPVWGDELLSDIEFPWPVKPIVRWHHERFDGSGYPDRLSGDRIPMSAQIVGILDYHDGLTMPRFGRQSLTPHQAVWEVVSHRSWWSPHVFDAFMRVIH